jgi:hypothetical protein
MIYREWFRRVTQTHPEHGEAPTSRRGELFSYAAPEYNPGTSKDAREVMSSELASTILPDSGTSMTIRTFAR